MNWLLLTILAILTRSTMSIATKLLTNKIKVGALTQTILFMSVGAVLTLVVSPFVGGISFAGASQQIWPIIGIILTQCVANLLFFKGQRHLEAGTTQIAFSSILVWSTAFSVLILHSKFSLIQLGGIVILLAAIVLAQYQKGVKKLEPGVILIISAATLYALFQVISAELAKHLSTAAYLILAYWGTSVVLALVSPKQLVSDLRKLRPRFRSVFITVFFASSMSVLYFTFSYLAYQKAPERGVVVVLLTSQVIVSVFLGIIFLRERTRMPQKVSAGIMALLAGILIKS